MRDAGSAALAVLQCTSSYPVAPEAVGLNVLGEIARRYGCQRALRPLGNDLPSLAAAALGGRVLEVHVTLSREMFGPDVPASVTTKELRQLCAGVRLIGTALAHPVDKDDAALAHPVDKDDAAHGMEEMRRLFTRSLVTTRALEPGTVLRDVDLAGRKPGSGIPVAEQERVVGRRLVRPVPAGSLLDEADLEPDEPQ